MATLEKIRKRSVLLFTIIIVALLAFILGDFLNSGRSFFSDPTTASKVAGHKIDIQELNNRVNRLKQQDQNADDGALREQVLNEMINEALFEEEIEKVGIVVTDDELTAYMFPESNPEQKAQMQQFYDAVKNPAKYGIDEQTAAQYKEQWAQMEKMAENQLKTIKYNQLLQNTLVPNKLDLAAERELFTHNTKARVVSKTTAELNDDDYAVSDDEIAAEYEKFKNSPAFKLNEVETAIDYIVVEVNPSEADYADAKAEVDSAVVKLKEETETQAVNNNYNFQVTRAQLTPEQLNQQRGQMQQYMFQASQQRMQIPPEFMSTLSALNVLDTLPAGNLWESGLSNDNYTIAKMIARNEVASDTDTVITYDFAIISYNVEPSSTTRDEAKQKISEFAKANNTAAKFEKNAADNGYVLQSSYVTPSSFALHSLTPMGDQPIPDTYNAAHWAVKAEKDQVSPVFANQQDNRFIVVAVKDIYKGDLIPVTDSNVRKAMTQRLRDRKKVEALAKEYAGKADNIEGYAELMGQPVNEVEINVNTAQRYGVQTLGKAAVAKKGALVGPVNGNGQVVVFEVIESGTSEAPVTDKQLAEQFKARMGGNSVARLIPSILRHDKKVETRVHDLMGGEQ